MPRSPNSALWSANRAFVLVNAIELAQKARLEAEARRPAAPVRSGRRRLHQAGAGLAAILMVGALVLAG